MRARGSVRGGGGWGRRVEGVESEREVGSRKMTVEQRGREVVAARGMEVELRGREVGSRGKGLGREAREDG